MKLTITMANERETGELESLYNWLVEDIEVSHGVKLILGTPEDEPGTMGPDAEAITAIISASASMVSAVAAAITVWQQNRPRGRGKVLVHADDESEPIAIGTDGTEAE